MLRHPKSKLWDDTLRDVFRKIDDYLEDKYIGTFPLHPARPERGSTSAPEMDGLFRIGASFSPGYGTKAGRGYVIEIHISTLQKVPDEFRKRIEDEVEEKILEYLPQAFPGRDLKVDKEGDVLKIHGDLSLGEI